MGHKHSKEEGDKILEELCIEIDRIVIHLGNAGVSFENMVNSVKLEITARDSEKICKSTWYENTKKSTLIATYHDQHRDASISILWTGPPAGRGGCVFGIRENPLEDPCKGIETFEQHFVKNVTLSVNIDGVLTHFIETPSPVVCPTTVLSAVTQCCHKDRRRNRCHKDRREKSHYRTHRSKDCCKNNRQKG